MNTSRREVLQQQVLRMVEGLRESYVNDMSKDEALIILAWFALEVQTRTEQEFSVTVEERELIERALNFYTVGVR